MTDKTKAELQDEVKVLQEEVKVLKEENTNLKEANQALGESFTETKALSEEQAETIKTLELNMGELEEKNEKLTKVLKRKPVAEVSTRPGRAGVYGKEL